MFVGWIPNVSGRLSYSHIGDSRHPKPCRSINEDDRVGRVLFVTQKRSLSDALVSDGYFKWLYGFEPAWVFALVASTEPKDADHMGVLVGHVFAFQIQEWRTNANSDSPAEIADKFETLVLGSPPDADHNDKSAERFRSLQPNLVQTFTSLSAFTISCEIDRFGIVRLSPTYASTRLRFTKAVTVAPHEPTQDDIHYLTSQAYFFVKDISHHHRHHSRKSDTITYSYQDDGIDTWARETHYSIHRKLVELRRGRDPRDLYDALGVMAYLQAFSKISKKLQNAETKEIISSYNNIEFESSIKATIERKRWTRVQANIMVTAFPALIISMASLLKPTAETPEIKGLFPIIISIFQSAFDNSIYSIYLLSFVLFMVPILYGVYNVFRTSYWYNFNRILVTMDMRTKARMFDTLRAVSYLFATVILTSYIFSGWISEKFEEIFNIPLINIDERAIGWTIVLIFIAIVSFLIVFLPYVVSLPVALRRVGELTGKFWARLGKFWARLLVALKPK